MLSRIDERRIRTLKAAPLRNGPVVYWMSRDQRIDDNWSLLFARQMAAERKVPLHVLFCLAPFFKDATWRHYAFMIGGLREVETALSDRNIPFHLVRGDPDFRIPEFLDQIQAGACVTDFDPLRIKIEWKKQVTEPTDIPFYEVDAHNIVPCRVVSDKVEYAAFTLRKKLNRRLSEFLTVFPPFEKQDGHFRHDPIDWDEIEKTLPADRSVPPVKQPQPGAAAAHRMLKNFLKTGLKQYETDRNDPNRDGQSNLSSYLHFGQISAQRIALEVQAADPTGSFAFLEELIVRRELSDNCCLFNPDYDSVAGFPPWARKTLDAHRKDPREYVYSKNTFETARTHDPLWNAAQKQMTVTGKMHGYLRMYWAKKILEWSASPEEAFETALYLNDRYELDGRDPNGYAGCAWSIGGMHDRPWVNRPVFGMIRYMSLSGCRRKFDVNAFVDRWSN
ncbi:deoxyribodipyrimidine photo-lyase [bacterium]|nr:deoxyribodipyrimidine photo-lyase [candidate division CSSED10-310 bacterium]